MERPHDGQDAHNQAPALTTPEALSRQVEGIFGFSHEIASAYQEERYKNSPGMEFAPPESIAEHMWDATVTWHNLELTCPNMAAGLDSRRVGDILRIHDMGEIYEGDFDIYSQLHHGAGVDKGAKEREAMMRLTSSLPERVQHKYLELYDEYEDDKTPEAWMAHITDAMCGSTHYCDTAENPAQLQETQVKIHNKKLVPRVRKLLQYFEQTGQQAAYEELMDVMVGFCNYVGKFGISLDPLAPTRS